MQENFCARFDQNGARFMLIFLLVVTIYGNELTPEIEKSPRNLSIETKIVAAKNPIIIEITNIDSILTNLIEIIKKHKD